MPDPKIISTALAVAAIVAAVVLLFFGLPRRAPFGVRRGLGEVLGISAGVFVGCLVLGAQPHWPPREDQDRLLFVLLPAMLFVELRASLPKVSWWFAWLIRLLIAAAAARVLLHGSTFLMTPDTAAPSDWSAPTGWLLLAELALALLLAWILLAWHVRGTSGHSMILVLAMACVAAGATIMLSGYATGGQLGMPMAGALVGATAASLVLPAAKHGHAALNMGVVLLFSLLVTGHFFGALSTLHAAVIFFSPLLCWLTIIPPVRGLKSWVRGILAIFVVAIPLTLVVADAYRQHLADSQPVPGSDSFEKDAAEMYK